MIFDMLSNSCGIASRSRSSVNHLLQTEMARGMRMECSTMRGQNRKKPSGKASADSRSSSFMAPRCANPLSSNSRSRNVFRDCPRWQGCSGRASRDSLNSSGRRAGERSERARCIEWIFVNKQMSVESGSSSAVRRPTNRVLNWSM